MGLLIDDLLNLSRVGRTELSPEPVDLNALAQDIMADLKEREPDRNVEFEVNVDSKVVGDSHLLRVAFENLLGNAWKYTSNRQSTKITFASQYEKGEKVYFIRDNGAGFDMAYYEKLFKPFQRLHAASEYEGTGIGLAIVARIIQHHGGRIRAESRVDQGATFYFTLPGL